MTRLLDARTSQNASYGNTISIPLPANTAVAIAELGLEVTGAGENMRVQLTGIAELAFPTTPPFDSVISFSIVRGDVDSLVAYALYSVSVSEVNPNAVQVVTINASDYNIPLPPSNELVYTLYIFCTADATRIGMESFNAVAYSD
ncbi:hypothetical protein ACT3XG_13425 [Paenibacillus polymyxa]|uniref:hypothetical protein n=1 Tax=Paenibacillus TaxID=44249 RepID=UPI00042E5737|nr:MULTISPECIES: hypothetical protein [Paenibacillus]MEB4781660.1 hypothetical protein [Paenibacillus jamilae]AHM66410.1 hypothetical protein PPSQR21_027680 [Paenibacillus polymyxa SQR-21]AIY07335.1 hypothetical protein LK13_01565 [Paenibacillus polymyxa]KAF6584441.1 hypothetical protein G9G57_10390 [Paenibacillus sp. EKM211P]KAF6659628.1 hypothetical protein HFD99_00020 [Paenibacillus sp. EKM301P]